MRLLRDQGRRLQERLEYIDDSKIFHDLDSPSGYDSTHVPHQALITSSSRKPSHEVGMLRNTRENMSIPGNVFDRQHAQRDPDDFSTIQEIWQHHWESLTMSRIVRKEGIENSGSEEPLQSMRLPCFSITARTQMSGRQLSLMSVTNHALGICTCTQVA